MRLLGLDSPGEMLDWVFYSLGCLYGGRSAKSLASSCKRVWMGVVDGSLGLSSYCMMCSLQAYPAFRSTSFITHFLANNNGACF